MKLFIPELETSVTLTSDWTFDLYHEARNAPLFEHFGLHLDLCPSGVARYDWTDPGPVRVTLKAGTILIVDRIYIRQGSSDYSSLTFRALFPGKKPVKAAFGKLGTRFWAKLNDVNNIEFDLIV